MTALLINPGSHIGKPGKGWTNTAATARAHAQDWLTQMHADGMTDVELLDGERESEGRWVFTFRHAVTGKTVELGMHGIDDAEAYQRENIFAPRVYWNGSSTADPGLDDFAVPGFIAVRTFRPACPECQDTGMVWPEPGRCTCGTGPSGYYGMHERHCGAEPCPAGCPVPSPIARREP